MSEVVFSDANFSAEALAGDQPVLVDFYADWCTPCKMQGPILEELAKLFAGQAKIGKLNVDENPQISQKFEVMSIPTIIIFKNGEVKEKLIGVQSQDVLAEKLKNLI